MRIKYRGLPAVLRTISLILLLAFIFFIAGQVLSNLRKKSRLTESPGQTEIPLAPYHKRFQALDLAGEKTRLSLKADHFYVDEFQKQHLAGRVEIVDQESAEPVRILASKVVIEPDKQLLEAQGEINLVYGSLQVQASSFEYNIAEKIGRAEKVWLEYGYLKLKAGRLILKAGTGQVELEGDVSGEGGQVGENFSLESSRFQFDPDTRIFSAEKLRLILSPLRLAGAWASARLREKDAVLEFISLEGEADARWRSSSETAEFQEISLLSDRMFVKVGQEISVLSAPGVFTMAGAGLKRRVSGGGDGLELRFTPGLEADCLKAGSLGITLTESDGEEFWLAGQEIDYDLTSGLLKIGEAAEVRHQDYRLAARQLQFDLQKRNFQAAAFHLGIRSGFFEIPVLLFSQGSSIFMVGEQLNGQPGIFQMSGRVRIWQAEAFCLADRVWLKKKSGQLLLSNLEKASWLAEQSGGRKERIEVRAAEARLVSDENRAILTGEVKLSPGQIRVAADELVFLFTAETPGRLSGFEARGRVRITWKDYLASGQQASHDFSLDQLVLTGNPELVTTSGEKLEADKLTLFLSDDKIRLENQKRERSSTILVRGR